MLDSFCMSTNAASLAPARPFLLKATSGGRFETVSFDQDYVNRLINREPEAEQHFCAYFGDLLQIKLRARVRSPQLLEDVKQETLLRVFKNLRASGIEHPERLGAYVNSVCNNVLFEAFRAESRFSDMGDEGPAMIDPKSRADEFFITRERKEHVAAVLKDMPRKDRELLTAIFLNEQDKDEVCRTFNIDRGYLRVLLHRARLKFKALFTDAYETNER